MGVCELSVSSFSYSKSNEKLADEITLLAGQINAANYRFLKLIAEFDRREAWGDGLKSCAHWLNWKCGIALGAAREKVRVARNLELLPKINAEFSSGSISYSKVRAMTRVATNDNEDYLLNIAKQGTASHVEKLVAKYQGVERLQRPDQQKQQYEQRQLVSYQNEQGMWIIHAKLPAEAGALIVKAIDAILAEQKIAEQQAKQQDKNTTENVSAETSVEEIPIVSYPKKRVDALTTMAEHYLATATNGDGIKNLAGNERCQVMLHVDIYTLRGHSHSHSQENDSKQAHCCNLDNKHWISPETAKRLSCDASLVTVLEDDKGNVLNIGRRSRTIPASIQRALSIRDTTCRYPGCCSSQHLDAHHIKHWANGGETSLDNLITLCSHHHRGLHQGDYSIQIKHSNFEFITAKGKQIIPSFYPQFPLVESASLFDQQWAYVDKNTGVTLWQGEEMNYDMAVAGL